MTAPAEKPIDESRRIAAVFLLRREDGAALMQLRDDKPGLPRAGMWVVPGGHCDPGESMEEAAYREFLEETGYRCHDLRFLYRVLDEHDGADTRHHLYLYADAYDGTSEYRCLEGRELRFLTRDEAGTLSVPSVLMDAWDDATRAIAPESEARSASMARRRPEETPCPS